MLYSHWTKEALTKTRRPIIYIEPTIVSTQGAHVPCTGVEAGREAYHTTKATTKGNIIWIEQILRSRCLAIETS